MTVSAGSTTIGAARSDPEGQWVLVPRKPLPPGAHTLTLSVSLPNNATVAGSEKVVVIVPHPRAIAGVSMLDSPAQPPPLEAPPPAGGRARSFNLDLIQYETAGFVSFVRHRPSGAEPRIDFDDHLLGEVPAGASCHWSLNLEQYQPDWNRQMPVRVMKFLEKANIERVQST
ncbi:MAG: hypothetical protein ACREFP_03805 [Acetobacteraceae bacterium]